MIMNEEVLVAVKNLCDLMKADPRYAAVNEAGKAYSVMRTCDTERCDKVLLENGIELLDENKLH